MGAGQRIVTANGVELCAEPFGDPDNPAILPIQGVGGSMDWWEDEFCAQLASGGRYVIRYDNRDTGRSVTYEPAHRATARRRRARPAGHLREADGVLR